MAEIVGEMGSDERAARLFGAAEAIREAAGLSISKALLLDHERPIVRVMQILGQEAFDRAWAEGRAMTAEEALAFALEGSAGEGSSIE